MEKTSAALQAYTKDFYAKTEFNNSNVVGSPLGSWLLLASIASKLDFSNNPELKARTEQSLHLSVEDAEDAVREILDSFPALNYVSQAWTTPDLSTLPAVQKWVDGNTLIPYEGLIPSQAEVDEWASTNTNELIKNFPSQMNEDTMLVIANIIYSKLTWETKFQVAEVKEAMASWNVKTILRVATTEDVRFCQNEDNDVFAIYEVQATGKNRESVHLITCLSRDIEPSVLLENLNNVASLKPVALNSALLERIPEEMLRVEEVRRGTAPTFIKVSVPAWDASTTHHLLENDSLGYQELAEAFGEGSEEPFSVEAKQVAVAKFDKEGFEAAALTALVMARCAMPAFVTQTVYELNFTKPFAFVSYTGKLPVFSGYICQAKEGE